MNEVVKHFSNGQFELKVSPHPVDGFRIQAPGLAKALGFRESFDLVRTVPNGEKGSELVRTPGGEQNVSYVTEAGFYRALGMRQVGRIQDEMARARVEAFQNWVYREVLPSIRMTGAYSPVKELTEREQLVALAQQVLKQDEQLQIAAPKAEAYDKFMDTDGLYSMEAAAKAIGYGRNVMFRELRRIGIIQGNNLPYQRFMQHFEIKMGTRLNRDGQTVPTATTMVRPKGVQFIGRKLAQAVAAVEEAGVLI